VRFAQRLCIRLLVLIFAKLCKTCSIDSKRGIPGIEIPLLNIWLYIDFASYTLTLVIIGQLLAIFSASSMLAARITV